MPATLPVHLNRESIKSLEVPAEFEAEGSFDVVLVNHGEAVHVHCNLDDALSSVATIEANNHYVEAGVEEPVRVEVDGRGTVEGQLEVATSYGTNTRYVDVALVEPGEVTDPVPVDESLAEPGPPDEESTLAALADDVSLPVLGLAGLAVVVAATAALTVGSPVVVAGAGVAVLGAVAAVALLLLE